MVPGHPSHSALGAFHPTPIASSRISTHPTFRRRRRKRVRMQCGALRRGRRRGRNPPERSCATVGARGNYVNPLPDGDHPRPGDNHDVDRPVARPVRLPRRSTSPPPERSPRGAHAAPCPATAAPPFPSPRHDDGLRGKPDFLSEAHGPSTVALQQRCHRASAPARRPSWPSMPRPRPQRPPPPGENPDQLPIPEQNFRGQQAGAGRGGRGHGFEGSGETAGFVTALSCQAPRP